MSRTALITVSCACVGTVCWLLFFAALRPPERWVLKIPADRSLRIQVDADGKSDEDGRYASGRLSCIIYAEPTLLSSGVSLLCTIDRFALVDANDLTLFFFERLPGHNFRYHSDRRLSTKRREELFKLFRVDLSSGSSSEDRSLLQQPFTIMLTAEGAIQEIDISPRVRDMLHSLLTQQQYGWLVEELLTYPEHLPPLLSNGSSKAWTTHGTFPTGTVMMHTPLQEADNYHVTSRCCRHDDVLPDTLSRLGVQLDDFQWTMDWQWDPKTHFIPSWSSHWQLSLTRPFLGNLSRRAYEVRTSMQITLEEQREAVEEAPMPG